MSGRRVPLSSNPNAANSPYRAVAAAAAAKQKRSYATVQREEAYGQPPPAKKQMLEPNYSNLKTPSRQNPVHAAEGRVFARRSNSSQPTALTRKLEAARAKPVQQTQAKADNKAAEENLETIRQWQRHYRRVFPKFVFYFESISEDQRIKLAKQVTTLGAREEKFFSNAVTHVVTTRPIPPEHEISSVNASASSSTNNSQSQGSQLQTINPLLLDRSSESTVVQFEGRPSKSKFTFEASIGRKGTSISQDIDLRRQQGRNADVLHRARELGMKIWAQEKLERMMITMFDTDTSLQALHCHNTRSNASQGIVNAAPRTGREADLSQLLRNERINGPSDRDPTVATKEMILFKGPFIYIHDIDEKLRPIMVREYTKVSRKEDGDWPQFRSVSNGKCPFIGEIDSSRRDAEREMVHQQKQLEREKPVAPRTRAATAAVEATRMEPPKASNDRRVLASVEINANGGTGYDTVKESRLLSTIPENRPEHSKGPQNAFVSRAGTGRLFGGEPVASGLQPSNITSAIRSQMISSTAAAPGTKAGTSKEVHGLQRKVLERNSGPASLGLTSSHRMTDIAAATREDAAVKLTRRGARDNLATIEEDISPTEAEEARQVEAARKAKAAQIRKLEKGDPKPGYCENCFDKFDDFDEHVTSRKHRKFAERSEHWRELDALLNQLARPFRDECY